MTASSALNNGLHSPLLTRIFNLKQMFYTKNRYTKQNKPSPIMIIVILVYPRVCSYSPIGFKSLYRKNLCLGDATLFPLVKIRTIHPADVSFLLINFVTDLKSTINSLTILLKIFFTSLLPKNDKSYSYNSLLIFLVVANLF